MFRKGLLSFSLFFFMLLPLGFPDPAVDVSLSKNKILTNETAQLTIQIQWPKSEGSYSIALPDLPLQSLTVTNQSQSQETFLKGDQEWTRKVFIFELTPKEAGEGSLESFTVHYSNPTAAAAASQFEVSALKIRIDKPEISWNRLPLWVVLTLAGAGSLGVLGATWLVRRRKQTPLAPEISGQEKFLAEIKSKIQSASRLSENALNEIYIEFRLFLKEIYGAAESSASESEILSTLQERKLPAEEFRKIEKILNGLREAKFTGQTLSDFDLQILKKEISELIDSKHINTLSEVH